VCWTVHRCARCGMCELWFPSPSSSMTSQRLLLPCGAITSNSKVISDGPAQLKCSATEPQAWDSTVFWLAQLMLASATAERNALFFQCSFVLQSEVCLGMQLNEPFGK
jgi:hypothetical protein